MSRLAASVLVGLGAALVACGGEGGGAAAMAAGAQAPAAAAARSQVTVKLFIFTPQRLVVRRGTTVRWTNEDSTTHTVVGRRLPAGSRRLRLTLKPGGSATRRFGRAGRYRYVCDLHPGGGMTATVVVR